MDTTVLYLAKKYTDDSLEGVGAIAGKPCQIESIEPITGGNKVTYLWEDNSGTEHTQSMNVMNGQKGDTGERGKVGETGATGEAGRTATIAVGTVVSGDSPAVTNVGTQNDGVFNFVLPKGDKGDRGEKGNDGADGKSFDIKAQYPTYDALIAAHPTGEAGDAYFVGTDENPDLYIWLTDDNEWFNNGKIAGVKGDKGDTGDDGFSPVASVSKVGKVATITIRDKVGQTTATVLDGEDGEDAQFEELPTASATNEGKICQYIGATSGSLVNGHFYQCVNQSGTFVWVEKFGSAMEKNATDRVQPNSHDLVESGSVYSAINSALSSIYTPAGDISCAELTSEMLINENVGKVYELSDAGTTTDLFLQGAGKPLTIGDNVGIINAGQGRILFNLMANRIDLSTFQKKNLEQAIEGTTTVESTLGALSDNKQAKTLTTSVESQTTVEGALGALSSNKAEKATTAYTFSFIVDASMQRTVKIPYGAKQLGIDIKSVSQNTRGSEFIANIVGYGTMQDNRAICLYKRLESTAILISDISDDGQYTSFIIGNPFATGAQTIIMTLYNIDKSDVTVEAPTSNTITTMGSRWQEYITSKEVSYSTSEIKTGGTWIDGKPIYRKCGTINGQINLKNAHYTVDATLTNSVVGNIINVGGSAYNSSTLLAIGGYYSSNNSGELRLTLGIFGDGLKLLSTASDFLLTNIVWWVEYTKTT